jgi:Ca2+-binding EF-hand superfamily protein
MKPLATAALALALLAGCGQAPSATKAPKKAAAKSSASAAAKRAAAVAEKGVLGLFKMAHAHLDADGDGALDATELAAAAEEEVIPDLPSFAALDKNGDAKITVAEFTHKDVLKGRASLFTDRVKAEFGSLDADESKALSKAEMADSDVTFQAADADKNGKVTVTEFEAALATALAKPAS